MSEKVYVLNVYNTMTGQYELIQIREATILNKAKRDGIP